MHFHWDNFDSVVSKAFRSLTPPLLNLLCVTYIFYQGLGLLLAWAGDRILSWSKWTSETVGKQDIPERLTDIFPYILSKIPSDLTLEEAGAGASTFGAIFKVLFSSALTGMAGFVFSIIIVAYILDFVVRSVGTFIPIRAEINERRLVVHPTLDEYFREAGVDVGSQMSGSRFLAWMHAKLQVEKMGKESSYFDARTRLLAKISMNERAFAYVAPYALFSLISISIDPLSGFLWLVFVVAIGLVILVRQFSLGSAIVANDLQTYAAMPKTDEIEDQFKKILSIDAENNAVVTKWWQTLLLVPGWMIHLPALFQGTKNISETVAE